MERCSIEISVDTKKFPFHTCSVLHIFPRPKNAQVCCTTHYNIQLHYYANALFLSPYIPYKYYVVK